MAVKREQARVFGEVADEYDRVRPGYPSALIDDVLAYANLRGAPALEVGAGTGKATVEFAQRAVAVTAVEPDEAMASVLARRMTGHPGVTVEVCAYEDFLPRQPYGLLYSAQAWHWTNPEVRWQKAAQALAPGGALALFWNNDDLADPALREASREVHSEHAPELRPAGLVGAEALATMWPGVELRAQPDFGDLVERLYTGESVMSTVDFLTYLSTQSDYRMLNDDRRAGLFAALVAVIGDEIRLNVETALYLARRR
jgi:SAM-dependent methyltransferase